MAAEDIRAERDRYRDALEFLRDSAEANRMVGSTISPEWLQEKIQAVFHGEAIGRDDDAGA